MKPEYARKLTTCHECRLPIEVGKQRATDVVRIRENTYTRVHYHYPQCLLHSFSNWFENHPYEKIGRDGAGRPSLNLSPEQKKLRHKALTRLTYIEQHYGEIARRVKDAIREGSAPSEKDINTYGHMVIRRDDALHILLEAGGIPKKYEALATLVST